MENIHSEDFLKEFHIPDYLLIPGSKGEYLRHVPACPVVVFINSRSGGQLGGDLLITYRSVLNPSQVSLSYYECTLSKFYEDMALLQYLNSLSANFN